MKSVSYYMSWWMLLVVCVSFGFSSYFQRSEEVDFKNPTFREIFLEDCLYIYVDESSFQLVGAKNLYSITHKGNCPNPIHYCDSTKVPKYERYEYSPSRKRKN